MANARAQAEKAKGNAAFKKGDYPNAIGHYTAALHADRNDYTFPLNRAAAYLKLGKNEDAERDCTTALALSALNAKALFRRGQARVGMNKLDEALSDLTQAMKREPTNESIGKEIKKVNDLIANQKPKQSKTPLASTPRRRRVPIKIIDSSTSATSPTTPTTSTSQRQSTSQLISPTLAPKKAHVKETPPANTSHPEADVLKPVSTRPLKATQPQPQPSPVPISSWKAPPSPPSTPSNPAPKLDQPRTFNEAKQARDSAKPSRVGGGIFRASGASTVFPTRTSPAPATPASAPGLQSSGPSPATAAVRGDIPSIVPSPIAVESSIPPQQPPVKTKAPMTLFDFSRTWEMNPSMEDRWSLITSIPPSSLLSLFKTSLEPTLLISIMALFGEVIRANGSGGHADLMRSYMEAFARVERFGTIVLFLSKEEKAKVREVWELLGVGKVNRNDVGRVWSPVWT